MIDQALVPRLLTVAKVAATFIQRREDVAVITVGDDEEVFVGIDYWTDAAAARDFEERAAAHAIERGLRSAVMVLPLVTRTSEEGIAYRPLLDGTQDDDETALLWFFCCSVDHGFDLARSLLTFDIDGNAHFQTLEILKGTAQLVPDSPGFALLQGLLAAPIKEIP